MLKQNLIKINPTTVKNITVVFLTREGEIPISFNVKRLPDVYLISTGQTTKEIIKSSLSNLIPFRLKSLNNNDTFFDNYKIISFQATLNGSSYKVLDNYFSNELRSAIMNSKNGDIVTISDIKSFNEDVNKSININGNFEFAIK